MKAEDSCGTRYDSAICQAHGRMDSRIYQDDVDTSALCICTMTRSSNSLNQIICRVTCCPSYTKRILRIRVGSMSSVTVNRAGLLDSNYENKSILLTLLSYTICVVTRPIPETADERRAGTKHGLWMHPIIRHLVLVAILDDGNNIYSYEPLPFLYDMIR